MSWARIARGSGPIAAIALLLLSLGIAWVSIAYAERTARPHDMAARTYVDFTLSNDDGGPVAAGRRLRAHHDGTDGYWADLVPGGTRVSFNIPFEVQHPDRQLALYLSIRELVRQIKVNGVTVQPDVPLQRLQGAVTSEPGLYLLPVGVLRQGPNILTIEKDPENEVYSLPEFSVGPAEELVSAYRARIFYTIDLPQAGVAILVFTALLCLIVNWPPTERLRMRWLVVYLLANATFTYVFSIDPPADLPLALTLTLIVLFNYLLGVTAFRYVWLDTAMPPVIFRWAMMAVALAGMISIGLLIASQADSEKMVPHLRLALRSSYGASILLLGGAIAAMVWRTAHNDNARWLEHLVLVTCFIIFIVDMISSITDVAVPFVNDLPVTLFWYPIMGVVLGLGLLLSLARQAGEARRVVVQSNAILAERLIQQNEELARSYAEQREMLATQATFEERQRIVRDMHDGIGGQLLGLLMQVRARRAKPAEVQLGLETSLADLRLIVDAMDTADGSYGDALQAFEHRVRPQVEAAGMALEMSHGLGDSERRPGPRNMLHVLRILQEAVTNAIRHSGATQLNISSEERDGALLLTIRDNGRGMPSTGSTGRGLDNMRRRAKELHGSIEFSSDRTGSVVMVRIPVSHDPSQPPLLALGRT